MGKYYRFTILLRSKLIHFLLIIISFDLIGQKIDNSLFLTPKWSKGDSKTYEINSFNQVTAEKLEESYRKNQRFNIKVIDVKETSTELLWKFGKVHFVDSIPGDNPFKILFNTITDTLTVRYTINKKGAIESIDNYKEISAIVKAKVDSAIQAVIRDPRTDQSKIQMLKFQFQMMFSTDNQINSIVLNDIFKFHQLYGASYKINKVTSIDEQPKALPNYANKLNVSLVSIDKIKKVYFLVATRYSPETETLTSDRKSLLEYKYNYPQNWLIQLDSYLETAFGLITKSHYSIKLID